MGDCCFCSKAVGEEYQRIHCEGDNIHVAHPRCAIKSLEDDYSIVKDAVLLKGDRVIASQTVTGLKETAIKSAKQTWKNKLARYRKRLIDTKWEDTLYSKGIIYQHVSYGFHDSWMKVHKKRVNEYMTARNGFKVDGVAIPASQLKEYEINKQ